MSLLKILEFVNESGYISVSELDSQILSYFQQNVACETTFEIVFVIYSLFERFYQYLQEFEIDSDSFELELFSKRVQLVVIVNQEPNINQHSYGQDNWA